jgi:hypothetical protein
MLLQNKKFINIMKKILIATFALITIVLLSCEKEKQKEDPTPIKFMSSAYSSGYQIQVKNNPQTLIHDFIALPSVSQGNDQDNYYVELYAEKELKTLYFKYLVSVLAKSGRETKGYYDIYRHYTKANNVVYYRIIREGDNKVSEIRVINFNWQ